nr:TMEM43 family protein [Pseudomonadota bacterium]
GYARAWSDAWIDSSAFLPGHENPAFPIRARRWPASGVSVDGVPLDPQVLQALGQWREFRPGFSALPGNLAATFQPQGDGLGSALNPLAPEVGDLRIHWRELVLPPLAGRIELRDGRWQLLAGAAASAGQDADAVEQAGDRRERGGSWWIFLAAMVPVAVAAIVLRKKRRRRS